MTGGPLDEDPKWLETAMLFGANAAKTIEIDEAIASIRECYGDTLPRMRDRITQLEDSAIEDRKLLAKLARKVHRLQHRIKRLRLVRKRK